MGKYNIDMFRKEGEKLSYEREQELSDKLSPILTKFSDKIEDLIHKFEEDLDVEEIKYFRRNIIYSILGDFNKKETYGDCIPDYVKLGWNYKVKTATKVILLILRDFDTWNPFIENEKINEKDTKIDLRAILSACMVNDPIFDLNISVTGQLSKTKMILKPEHPAEQQCKEILIENPQGIHFREFVKAIEKLSYGNHIFLEDIKRIGNTDDGIPIYNIHLGS